MRRGKYEKITVPAFNIMFFLALVLFVLVALSTYMTQNLFARYVVRDSGGDSARVVKFAQLTVSEEGLDENNRREFIFAPGAHLTKEIKVSFGGSEAGTYVFLLLDTPGWTTADYRSFVLTEIPAVMNWSVAAGWKHLETADGRHVYYLSLEPNQILVDHPVIADKTIYVSPEVPRTDYEALYDMDLDIRIDAAAYAVQANGFGSAQEAWEALRDKEVQP